jgi:hypothetical protein
MEKHHTCAFWGKGGEGGGGLMHGGRPRMQKGVGKWESRLDDATQRKGGCGSDGATWRKGGVTH